jgi:MFS family permease
MQTRRARPFWLTPNLLVLSWVSLLQDTASELLYPVLPIFLTTTLGAPLAVVGIIEGTADGAAAITRVVSGRLADRRARRPLVAGGYGAAAAGKLLVALATSWPVVLAARVVDRVGKGVRGAPRDALIADEVPAAARGRAFGFHRSLDTWGAVLGPLIGLGLYEALGHRIRPMLWIAVVPACCSVVLVALVAEHRPHPAPAAKARARSTLPLPHAYWRLLGVLSLFALVNFPDALLILRARALGLGVTEVIGAYCLYNLTYAVLSYPAGAVSDRLPRRVVFASGLVVFAVAYTGLGAVTTSAWVWVLFPVYGAYTALTEGVGRAWIVDVAPATARGYALGLQQGIAGGATILAGLWAGLAWHGTGRIPLTVSGIATGALALAVFVGGGRMARVRALQP